MTSASPTAYPTADATTSSPAETASAPPNTTMSAAPKRAAVAPNAIPRAGAAPEGAGAAPVAPSAPGLDFGGLPGLGAVPYRAEGGRARRRSPATWGGGC